ncbi:MAG TPA: hypothetical protein PKH46_07055, partial [Candidatus Cryosericum sp.]|nr:hypothetical protein [Candidatus Cryosericum sp.]
ARSIMLLFRANFLNSFHMAHLRGEVYHPAAGSPALVAQVGTDECSTGVVRAARERILLRVKSKRM